MVSNPSNDLRVWPGLAAVAVQWLVRFGLPAVAPETSPYAIIAGVAGGGLVAIWWLAFSRAPWLERLGVLAVAIAGMTEAPMILHRSIATAMMGMMFPIVGIPFTSLAWVGAAWAVRRLRAPQRPVWISAAILCAFGSLALLRTDGIAGEGFPNLAWRWSPDAEQKLLASAASAPLTPPLAPVRASPALKPLPDSGIPGTPPRRRRTRIAYRERLESVAAG